jgi:hypothetical protein
MLDGDCQFPPMYIPKMLEALVTKECDVVFCNRTILVGNKWRVFASKFFLILTRMLMRFDGPDINAGIRGMTSLAKNNLIGLQYGRLANLSIWYQAKTKGISMKYIDVLPVKRIAGKSSISWWNPFALLFESLIEIRKIRNSKLDFKFFESL